MTEAEARAADLALAAACEGKLCSDCPPEGYPNHKTRCLPCPRRMSFTHPENANAQ